MKTDNENIKAFIKLIETYIEYYNSNIEEDIPKLTMKDVINYFKYKCIPKN